MSQPDVSVLLTCYNAINKYPSGFLTRAIESVLDHQDGITVELCITDDGSDDGTAVELARLARDDERVKVKYHTQRRGVAAGFNTAAALATGKYVILLSVRGWYEPGALVAMKRALDLNPAVGFVYGDTQYHGAQQHLHIAPEFDPALFEESFVSLYGYMYRAQALNTCKYESYLQRDGLYIDICDYDFVMQLIRRLGWRGQKLHALMLHYFYDGVNQMTNMVHANQSEIDAEFRRRWLTDRVRVGWLADEGQYKGGAELESDYLAAHAPEWASVVRIPPGSWKDSDVYVVHNSTQYDRWVRWELAKKPFIKRVHDTMPNGDPFLRAFLLSDAHTVILSGPLHKNVLRWHIGAPVEYLPSAMEMRPLPERRLRHGVVSINRWWPGKGLRNLRQWAIDNRVTVDVYGHGPETALISGPLVYRGELKPEAVPDVLARYKTFVFLPDAPEPYSRAVVEAWQAGCEIVTNEQVGATWWIRNQPEAIGKATETFWNIVAKAAGRG